MKQYIVVELTEWPIRQEEILNSYADQGYELTAVIRPDALGSRILAYMKKV